MNAICTAPAAAWSAPGVAPVTVTSSTASSARRDHREEAVGRLQVVADVDAVERTLIVFCGRPLIVAPRGPADVSRRRAGTRRSERVARDERQVRDLLGRNRRRDRGRLRLDEFGAAFDFDGLGEAADFERGPDAAGVAASSRTSLTTAVLKPSSVTVTVYGARHRSPESRRRRSSCSRASKERAGGVVLDRDRGAGNHAAGAIHNHAGQRRVGRLARSRSYCATSAHTNSRQQPIRLCVHEVLLPISGRRGCRLGLVHWPLRACAVFTSRGLRSPERPL